MYHYQVTQLRWKIKYVVCSEGALCRVIVISHMWERVLNILRMHTGPQAYVSSIQAIYKGQQPLSTPRTMVHSSLNQKNQWQPSHKRDAATRWTLNPVSIKYTQPPHTPTQWWTSYLKVCERMRMQLTSHHEFIVDALKYWSVRGRAALKLINQAWTFCANRWDKHERQIGVYLQAQSNGVITNYYIQGSNQRKIHQMQNKHMPNMEFLSQQGKETNCLYDISSEPNQ